MPEEEASSGSFSRGLGLGLGCVFGAVLGMLALVGGCMWLSSR